jgi:hypothetical protein
MSKSRRIVCWQGWKIQIPRRWDPVKLEGDHSEGHALFADTLRPRLGLRWQTLKKKIEPAGAVRKAMRAEVGQLAADEVKPLSLNDPAWQSPLLYLEPEPPGRDVFSAFSEISGRLLQVAYHAHRRENLFAATILPTLADLPIERAHQWSIFDLNCVIPGGMKLKSQRLNAGDLALTFNDRYQEITIRQIAVAQLALQWQSLDGWIADQQKTSKRYHHPTGKVEDTVIARNHKGIPARLSRMQRRFRYALLWNQPRSYATIAAHDADRDRLILLHGTDESLLEVVGAIVGML